MHGIDSLLRGHEDNEAWLFGKGPSLDVFDFTTAGKLRICINESVCAVPSPTYFFAHDEGPIRNVAGEWPNDCRAILQQPRAEFAVRCGIDEDLVYVYDKRYADNTVRDMDAEAIAKRGTLYGNSGTVHCAIHFCRLIGAIKIHLVGFDGTGGYAKAIGLLDGGAEHDRIRRDSISLMNVMGIPHEFFQAAETQD